jgi:hypothetical protein
VWIQVTVFSTNLGVQSAHLRLMRIAINIYQEAHRISSGGFGDEALQMVVSKNFELQVLLILTSCIEKS